MQHRVNNLSKKHHASQHQQDSRGIHPLTCVSTVQYLMRYYRHHSPEQCFPDNESISSNEQQTWTLSSLPLFIFDNPVACTPCRCCCLFYKAAKEIQQQEIMQLAWEQLASNLNSLVRQHDVFVQLEFEDVLRLLSRSVETAQGTAASSQAAPPAAAAGAEAAAADVEWAAAAGWQDWPAAGPGSNPPAQQAVPNRVVLWG